VNTQENLRSVGLPIALTSAIQTGAEKTKR